MHQYELSHEQRAIQEMARRFTATEITPNAAHWDAEHIFPAATIKKAGELGFGAIQIAPEYGGSGLGRLESALVFEAMAYGCPATSALISIHNMATGMIDRFGSPDLKARILPRLVTMETMASYCLTEPMSGSDAAALSTTARRNGDQYIVNGSKSFISGGGVNGLYVVMARTGGEGASGISALVIEKDQPGVSFGAQERKLGWHAQPTAAVHFDAVAVPVANRIGDEGQGFGIAMAGLDGGRLSIGACSLGGAQRALDEAVAYCAERRQFGQAIIEFQNTRFVLADMETELQAARSLLYLAAAKVQAGTSDATRFAAMAKRFATDTGCTVADRAMQMLGGYGYLMDHPVERLWRDLRVHRILEGTNEIMRLITAREMLRGN